LVCVPHNFELVVDSIRLAGPACATRLRTIDIKFYIVPMPANALRSLCLSASVFALFLTYPSSFLLAQAVRLDPKSMPAIAHVDERFQSYNVEMIEITGGRFWAPYKSQASAPADTEQPTPGGMPASLYRYRPPVDLSNPRLRKLAAALGPAYMRVSGTWANSTYFADSEGPAPEKPPAGFNGVLTRAEWRGVVDFARAADAELVTSFAISPGVRDANGVWTSTEAQKILDYTKSIGGSIAAAEMFNEPTFASMGGAPKGYDAASYGRDFHAFHDFMQKAAPSVKILGPGAVGEGGLMGNIPGMKVIHSADILRDEGPGLDVFSYHFYGGVSKRCNMMGGPMGSSPETALSNEWLSRTLKDEEFYAKLRDEFLPGKPIWLTETGETACGGDPWASDFIDAFRYLNQLGALATKNVQVVMHNTLNASDYAFIDESTLMPRPDYWAAVLWRRLMGTTVLDAGPSSSPNLHLYAQCLRGKPGGVDVLAINVDRTKAAHLRLPQKSLRYTLTSDDLMSPTVMLNGVMLQASEAGDLPPMNGASQKSGDIELAPISIAFFAIPGAHNNACR
jgi:heparanase